MRTLPILLAVAAFGCGDNIKLTIDGGPGNDAAVDAPADSGSGGSDAGGSDAGPSFPPAPTIGAQIDRMGRPLTSSLVDLYGSGNTDSESNAYDQDADGSAWQATYTAPFAVSLALLDTFDTGFYLGSDGSGNPVLSPGCGNQVLYNGVLFNTNPPAADSYVTLAGLLADDELYLDASTALAGVADIPESHANYLSVELDVAGGATIGLPHVTCGGRAPLNDVIGASYSALTLGIAGFSNTPVPFMPLFTDGATAHDDVDDDTFPFLGAPH